MTPHRITVEYYRTYGPERLPVIQDMMQRIASHPELPDLVEQELLAAPGPVLEVPYLDTGLYGRGLRSMHSLLTDALERV